MQGIFGVGGERQGRIRVVVSQPDEPITEATLTPDMAGQVIVGGSNISGAALRKASATSRARRESSISSTTVSSSEVSARLT